MMEMIVIKDNIKPKSVDILNKIHSVSLFLLSLIKLFQYSNIETQNQSY